MPRSSPAAIVAAFAMTVATAGCESSVPADVGPSNLTSDSMSTTVVHSSQPSAPGVWRVENRPAIRIDGDGPVGQVPLDPASVFVDSRGRILVADGITNGWDAILVYDSGGAYQKTIGRAGEGPGEFRQLWWASAYRGDSIAAFDMAKDAILVFDEDGAFGREVAVPRGDVASWDSNMRPGFTNAADGPFADGSFLAYTMGGLVVPPAEGDVWIKHELIRLSPEGQSWSPIAEERVIQVYWDGERMAEYLFGSYAHRSPYGMDMLYGDATTHELALITTEGEIRRIIRWDGERHPVTDAVRDEYIEWFLGRLHESGQREGSPDVRERLEQAPHAEFKPAYSQLVVDSQSSIWVQRYRLGQSQIPSIWDVFDQEGRWLTTLEMPDRLEVSTITADRVLGFVVDDLGVKHVQVHALVKDGRASPFKG